MIPGGPRNMDDFWIKVQHQWKRLAILQSSTQTDGSHLKGTKLLSRQHWPLERLNDYHSGRLQQLNLNYKKDKQPTLLTAFGWQSERSLYVSAQRRGMLILSRQCLTRGITFINWTLRLKSTDPYIVMHEVLYNSLTLIPTIWRPFSTLQMMI